MAPDWLVDATEGSQAGAPARDLDWERTSLGAPELWPENLRSAVRLCFGTRFPVLVTWGDDLTMIYNDGYRMMLGTEKHPAAVGSPSRLVWGEIWEDVGGLFAEVTSSGQPTWSEDQLLAMHRSGFAEETYFTFSYSALRDDDGSVAGLLDIAYETTDRVVDRRRLETVTGLSARLQGLRGGVDELGREVLEASADVRSGALHLWTEAETLEPLRSTLTPVPTTASRDVLLAVARSMTAVRIGPCLIAPLAGRATGGLAASPFSRARRDVRSTPPTAGSWTCSRHDRDGVEQHPAPHA